MFHFQSTRPSNQSPLPVLSWNSREKPYLLPVFVCVSARPKEMCTCAHSSALIWFLQKFWCSKCTLSSQGLMILFTEALHPLKSTNDQGDSSQLCFRIADFILIERKCLTTQNKEYSGSIHQQEHFPKFFRANPLCEMAYGHSHRGMLYLLVKRHKLQLRWKTANRLQLRSLFQLCWAQTCQLN